MANQNSDVDKDLNMAKQLGRRGAARFAAVQALYQLEMGGASTLEPTLMEFITHRSRNSAEGLVLGQFDTALMEHVVRGVVENFEDIDAMLQGVLAEGWSMERQDKVLRSVLRAGTFELGWDEETPGPVIVNEYVNIAKSFFEGPERKFVNGTLDALNKALRPE